jgi:GH24 family phage-related lysozyme (muramidase)/LysM repeat protein
MSNKEAPSTDLASEVKVKLIDPLGNSIEGLKYQIREGGKIVAKGVTDGNGSITKFVSRVGAQLEVYVERFASDGMKQIRTLVPWAENFSVKLASAKVKQTIESMPDKGSPGEYKRKTHIVKSGDTLSKIAAKEGTTAEAIARLNGMRVTDVLAIDRVLKLPVDKPAQSPAPAAAPAAKESKAPIPIKPESSRGENGTPKATVNASCDKSECLKVGATGPLVEELNIRLFGFGGTITPGKKWNEYTDKTAAAVKQFQRDYMGVTETGTVCGGVLQALDEFRTKYPVTLADMKCVCGKCSGFGHGYKDSAEAGLFTDKQKKHPYTGTEFPGIHRALIWSLRAALFYTEHKDAALDYHFLKISSGYRCWHDNKNHNRHTTNHMGNALDVQFRKGSSKTRCQGAAVNELRSKIFVNRMSAQLGWPGTNKISLERAEDGATSWVHMDVRTFDAAHKADRYYATTQGGVDGAAMIEMARLESRFKLINCAGIPPAVAESKSDRMNVDTLSLSAKGLDFIKGWEKFSATPYDDSEGFCTVGYGHLIAKKKCAVLAAEKNSRYEHFKNGISKEEAEDDLADNVERTVQVVKKAIQVPLYQQEFDALVSLAFNTGGIKKFPKLIAKVNTKDYSGGCDEFADITNGGTEGLVKRRQAEMKIFRNNVYDSSH